VAKSKTIAANEALEKLRDAGYLVEYHTPPRKSLAIRFYCDLSKKDVPVLNNQVDAVVINELCKEGPIESLITSMK
jgi:hypothetical protein